MSPHRRHTPFFLLLAVPWRPAVFPLLLLTPILLSAGRCDRKPELQSADIETMIRGGDFSRATRSALQMLDRENGEQASLLSQNSLPHRNLKTDPAGSTIAWTEGRLLFYWRKGHFIKKELPVQPLRLGISQRGKFLILLNPEDKSCQLRVYSIEKGEFGTALSGVGCQMTPAITDEGTAFYSRDDFLWQIHSVVPDARGAAATDGKTGNGSEEKIVSYRLRPRYSKIVNFYHLFAMSAGRILIFHGSAGYYNLYLYSSPEKKMRLPGGGFAFPDLFFTADEMGERLLFVPERKKSESGTKTDSTVNESPLNDGSLRSTSERMFFLVSGATGAYRLRPLHDGESPRLEYGFPLTHTPSLSYLTGRKEFLMIREGFLARCPTPCRKIEILPLSATRFWIFRAGLIYTDRNHHLYLRRTPFSEKEKDLLLLYQRARKQ